MEYIIPKQTLQYTYSMYTYAICIIYEGMKQTISTIKVVIVLEVILFIVNER